MRILFVAMHNSIHTARWINQLSETRHEILLFPPYTAERHYNLEKVRRLSTWGGQPCADGTVNLVSLWPFRRGAVRAELMVENLTGGAEWRVDWLIQAIRRFKPDVVHSLEFQSAGYLTLQARDRMGAEFPPWIATNWGSDIYLFGRLSDHREKIERILLAADYYSAECQRDVRIAKEWGFNGEVLPVLPNGGGFDLAWMRKFIKDPGKTSSRRVIAVKGYQHFAGRALTALDAICLAADALQDYEIQVYAVTPDVALMVKLVEADYGLNIHSLAFPAPREAILRVHGAARVSIGIGISDAISTSFLEALVLKSVPIQANTACVDEWINDGEGGFIVSPYRAEEIADRIRTAVTDDEFIDNAVRINERTVTARLASDIVRERAIRMYEALEKGLIFELGQVSEDGA